MNRDRFYLGIVTALIVTVIIYASYGILNSGKEEPHYAVSVFVSNSGSDRWNAFKEGLNQGAKETGLYLNVVSAPAFSGISEEYSILKRELENGADGLIVALCDTSDPGEQLSKLVQGEELVLIGSDLDLEDGHALVQPDAQAIGAAIAEMVLENEKEASGATVGVLTGNLQTLSGRQRLDGFRNTLADAGDAFTVRFWAETEAELSGEMANAPDILVALDSDAMELALDCLTRDGERMSCRLYGAGRSERSIYYLDRGMIRGMVVEDEYAMGYESAWLIQNLLEHIVSGTTQIQTGFISVTKDEMYEKGTEKILFPVVH